jgi:hypothetical protein
MAANRFFWPIFAVIRDALYFSGPFQLDETENAGEILCPPKGEVPFEKTHE